MLRRIVPVMICLTVIAGVIEARAASGGTLRRSLRSNRTLSFTAFPHGRELLSLPPIELGARESRLVVAQLRARNASTESVNQQVGVSCDDGDQVQSVRTSRNNLGIRQRYAAGPGVLTLTARYLVSTLAPSTIRCSLWAQSQGRSISAVHRDTWIEIRPGSDPMGMQWIPGTCNSRGVGEGCIYLVPHATKQKAYADRTYVLEQDEFVADPRAREIQVLGDVEFTTCYRHTASCLSRVSRYGGGYRSLGVVDTRLEAIQLNASGEPCATSFDPAPRHGSSPTGAFTRSVIEHRVHHYKIHHSLYAKVRALPGCTPRFIIRVYARAVGGDPVKIEGSNTTSVDGRQVQRSYSNGIARSVL